MLTYFLAAINGKSKKRSYSNLVIAIKFLKTVEHKPLVYIMK